MKISLAIIARDNDDVIESTLRSVETFVDEIVVVDTGSVDGTISVAERCGAKIHHFEWIDDFSAARNYSFSKCSGDWIMWLDTGDVIPPESASAFLRLKNQLSGIPDNEQPELIYALLNRDIDEDGIPSSNYPVARLARRSANPNWERPIHEVLVTDNNVGYFFNEGWVEDRNVQDHSERNLEMLIDLASTGDSSVRTISYLASEFYEQGRYNEALLAYDSIIQRNDYSVNHYEALVGVGKCHRQLNDIESAINPWLEALWVDSTRAEAWLLLGEIFYEQEEFAKALPYFKAVTALKRPEDASAVRLSHYSYLPYERLGFCYLGLNQDQKALEAFQQAAYYAPPKKAEQFVELMDSLADASNGSKDTLGA